jgi:hypothetical protein
VRDTLDLRSFVQSPKIDFIVHSRYSRSLT